MTSTGWPPYTGHLLVLTASPGQGQLSLGGRDGNRVSDCLGFRLCLDLSDSLSWVSVLPAGGTGSRNVRVTAAENTGGARSGSITIAGSTYRITQEARICTYSITPVRDSFPWGAGRKSCR